MISQTGAIEYRIERSSRRTVVITVRPGEVIVRAPYGVSEEMLRRFVESKHDWIVHKLAAYGVTVQRFGQVRSMCALLDEGAEKPVCFGAEKSFERDGVFYFRDATKVRRYFERTRGWMLAEGVHAFSLKAGLRAQDVRLCDFKARWGSCDAKGVIKLNWRLLMLPPALRDYVLIHEVCHLAELNHSAAFWNRVARLCPEYKRLRAELKEYAFLTEMYRA